LRHGFGDVPGCSTDRRLGGVPVFPGTRIAREAQLSLVGGRSMRRPGTALKIYDGAAGLGDARFYDRACTVTPVVAPTGPIHRDRPLGAAVLSDADLECPARMAAVAFQGAGPMHRHVHFSVLKLLGALGVLLTSVGLGPAIAA